MVKAIESYEEFSTLINSGSVVVVDFWATWCGPCKLISPHFNKLEPKHPNVKFVKVDVEEQDQIAKEQGIRSMPTFRVFKDGKQIDESVGAVPAKLTALVEKAAASADSA